MESSVKKTTIKDVLLISRPNFSDDRGFFRETFRKNELEETLGRNLDFVQGNHSHSKKATLRGIHIAPWDKLITVTSGQVQQVVVDLRESSETFGKYESFILGEPEYNSIFVPKGCGNSFLVLSEQADYVYFVTDYWAAGKELSLKYNDETLNVAWQLNDVFVSDRDKTAPSLKELFPNK